MHPILLQIGSFFVGSYGVLIMLGVVGALLLAMHLARRRGLRPEFLYDLAFVCLLAGFVGARLLFLVVEWRAFVEDPVPMLLSRSGFVFLGGLVAAIAVALWFVRRAGMPLWETADVAAPGVPLAHAFGRVGCYMAGCCYGRVLPEGSPWAVKFPRLMDEKGETLFGFAWQDHVEQGLVGADSMFSAPVLPSQLLEVVANLLICGALLLAWRRRRYAGQILVAYLALYGVTRFGLEFLRGDAARGAILGLSTSQFISLGALGAAGGLHLHLRRTPLARIGLVPMEEPPPGDADRSDPPSRAARAEATRPQPSPSRARRKPSSARK